MASGILHRWRGSVRFVSDDGRILGRAGLETACGVVALVFSTWTGSFRPDREILCPKCFTGHVQPKPFHAGWITGCGTCEDDGADALRCQSLVSDGDESPTGDACEPRPNVGATAADGRAEKATGKKAANG